MGVSFCMTIHHVSGAEKQVKCGRSRCLYSACLRRHSGVAGARCDFSLWWLEHRYQFALTGARPIPDQQRRCEPVCRLTLLPASRTGTDEPRRSASSRAAWRNWLDVNPACASRRCAAPSRPAIACTDTPHSWATSRAEWGRWQPSPKNRRTTFSCDALHPRRWAPIRSYGRHHPSRGRYCRIWANSAGGAVHGR
jgi:hypothetical protein